MFDEIIRVLTLQNTTRAVEVVEAVAPSFFESATELASENPYTAGVVAVCAVASSAVGYKKGLFPSFESIKNAPFAAYGFVSNCMPSFSSTSKEEKALVDGMKDEEVKNAFNALTKDEQAYFVDRLGKKPADFAKRDKAKQAELVGKAVGRSLQPKAKAKAKAE